MTYRKILSGFKKKSILVIGDLILDRYIWGKVTRISPEAPVPIVEVTEENVLLGGASNVAHNIVALGAHATVAGLSGNDRGGEILAKMLEEKGIRCEGVYRSARPTTVKTRVIAHSQQVVRFDREDRGKIDGEISKSLLKYITSEIPKHDAVILSKNVSLITPNLLEASLASGIEIRDEKSLVNAGRTLLRKIPCEAVLITRGEYGMSLFTKRKVVHIPTVAKNVYDVTGAGDTVIATFTLAHAAGAGMEASAVIANHAAGIVVGEVGTAVVTLDEVQKSLAALS
jgi:bifunctional ADP-heptose synthase (sugar kinase/adenylyltransferase)